MSVWGVKEVEEETLISITKGLFVKAYVKTILLKTTCLDIYVLPVEDIHTYPL